MRRTIFETDERRVVAGYTCPCGCTPSATHTRGGAVARSSCCCGNEFAVGPHAEATLEPRTGFALETEARTSGWGSPLTAAWLIGPSVHPEPAGDESTSGHDHGDHRDAGDAPAAAAIDPVCGMHVERTVANERGLVRTYRQVEYLFCATGCYLDFGDDPERYLDPAYVPSM